VPGRSRAELLLELADDELILGWRDSEWTGIAPFLEEDVAFSSIAQNEIGHARALYELAAAELGVTADELAFDRGPGDDRCAPFVELRRLEWARTIARHFLYETADALRLAALAAADDPEIAAIAARMAREEVYHRIHAGMWIDRLLASPEGRPRLEEALEELWPYALGVLDDELRPELAARVGAKLDRPLPDDIDAIPFPAFHLFKIDRYTNLNPLTDGLDMHARTFTIVTSRGCPYKCTYCSKPITGDTWRGRTVENVIAEWSWLVNDLGATEIGITDDIWNLDKNRAKELCRALIKAKLNHVPWVTIHGMKVNNTDLELFQLMKQAGCRRVGFGVENGDDWMLRHVIKKGQTVDMVRQAFKWSKQAKLQTMGFFIFGMPGETEESMEKTIRLALELDPDLAHFMMAAPFPGTEMWETLKKHGDVFSDTMDWSQIAIQDDKAHFAFDGLNKETVERKWHEAHRRFYLRPKRIVRIAARKDTWQRFPYYLKTAANMLLGLGEREATAA
jgi:phenylacetate-CoA oxygenase PaaI subunit